MRMFNKLVLIATLLAVCVVVLGAYVRLSDAGLGCPDWPGCYGTLTVPQSESAIAHAQVTYPDSPVEHGKAWKEMIHRYLAGALGLLVLAIFVQGWRMRDQVKVAKWLPAFLLALIVFQAALGMWTVTLLLRPIIVSAHLIGGMSTLAILTWMTHRHWGVMTTTIHSQNIRFWVRGAILVVFIQIFLGGWTSTNYAALACTDFPTCHGMWIPEMDFSNAFNWFRELGVANDGTPLHLAAYTAIQWTHRIGALVTFVYLGWLGLCLIKQPQLKKIAHMMLGLLVIQIILGIANLVLHLPLALAVGHNMGAALLLVSVIVLNSKITALKAK
jgi:cytochrome c oxidase assembly protein subunit 15